MFKKNLSNFFSYFGKSQRTDREMNFGCHITTSLVEVLITSLFQFYLKEAAVGPIDKL